jgi:peptide-methionine (S)-S-oxide reductase
MRTLMVVLVAGVAAAGVLARTPATKAAPVTTSEFPNPARDVQGETGERKAVFAGGCFWGVEAVFDRLAGVKDVVSGYAGGKKGTAHYEIVGTGTTGHAESVEVTYDAAAISYGQLLKVFFAVAHDPTEINRQGPDVGPQYRSEIFALTPEQQSVATAYIQQLDAARVFPRRIATAVSMLGGFYPAEDYHQNFLDRHPSYPYIVYNDLPKLEQLKRTFPDMLKAR